MPGETIVFLLNSAPRTWCSREDGYLHLCRELVRRDVRPVLVFARSLPSEIETRLREGGAEIASISYRRGVLHYFRELSAIVRRYAVTTVHVAFFDYFSAVPALARLSGVRYIVYEMRNGGAFSARSWRKGLLQLRNRLATAPVSRVIAVSEFTKEQLVRGGIAPDRIIVRYHGVDTSRFTPDPAARSFWAQQYAVGPDDLILSFVAHLRQIKHPQVAVETCAALTELGVPTRLFVAGGGSMLTELEALSRRIGVADRTHFLGALADPRPLMQASDVFLLPSVGEAFGFVLAEAMACGAPVVGSRSGAIGEVVEEGRTGLLARPLDPSSFAEAIRTLASDAELRRRMSRQAVERVREKFTIERAAESTVDVYESLWGSRAPPVQRV